MVNRRHPALTPREMQVPQAALPAAVPPRLPSAERTASLPMAPRELTQPSVHPDMRSSTCARRRCAISLASACTNADMALRDPNTRRPCARPKGAARMS